MGIPNDGVLRMDMAQLEHSDAIANVPQNVYDVGEFFDHYVQLDRQVRGLDGAPEWPQLRAMLPKLKGTRVLDLGCGMGWFSRWAREHEAAYVRGVDLSERMLEKARSLTTTVDKIEYERADLDELRLPESEYDLVFSSLAFHYLVKLPELMGEIRKSLRPGGRLVFSIEHPIFTGPTKGGFKTDNEGEHYWPLDAYQKEGLRLRSWFVDGVRKQHRTLQTYINLLLRNGLELTDFVEWCPTAEVLEKEPEWASELMRPTFLLMGATKKAG